MNNFSKDGFWRFAYERQAIWYRRVIEKKPWPWTEDQILKTYWFCNVHRELDMGTMVLFDTIIRPSVRLSDENRLKRIMMYRVFNNFRAWLACASDSDEEMFANFLSRESRGESCFTAAWTVGKLPYPGKTRVEQVRHAIGNWDLSCCVPSLIACPTLKEAWAILRQFSLMGEFTAFQVALDLTYWLHNLDDDTWVFQYDSSSRKIKCGWNPGGSGFAGQRACDLRASQFEDLSKLQLDWDKIAWKDKPFLHLADIEHTLCEYVKYMRFLTSPKYHLRRYRYER